MVVGVPLLNGRVAPRCTRATQLLLVTVSRGRVTARQVVEVEIDGAVALLELIRRHHVGALVCGGITTDDRAVIQSDDVDVIENVACSVAEVIAAIDSGTLRQGLGFDLKVRGRTARLDAIRRALERYSEGDPESHVDCLGCSDRTCLQGLGCAAVSAIEPPAMSAGGRRLLDAATDIALERDRQLCRVAELVYLCLEMEYRRVGIAFCTELLEPAQILTGVMRRFVEVVPVCCKIGGVGALSRTSDPVCRPAASLRPACNPLLQARVLNDARTQLNVLVGLCVGADAVFTGASDAPVTALFVKDRSLANNPIGAVYSEYYLHESVALPRTRRTRGGEDRPRTEWGVTRQPREEP